MSKLISKAILNSIVGLVLVIIWLQFVNFSSIVKILESVNLISVLPFFFFFVLSTFFRVLRLKILVTEIKLPFFELLPLNFLSQLLSYLIPVRAGEISRGVYFNNRFNISFTKAIIWILIDRFLDFMVVVILASAFLSIIPTDLPTTFRIGILIIGVCGFLIGLVTTTNGGLAKKIAQVSSQCLVFDRLKRFYINTTGEIIDGFNVLKVNPFRLSLLIILTLGALISDGLIGVVVLSAVGINLPFVDIFTAQMLWSLTFLIPSAPGFIGSAQVSGLAIYSGVFGINPDLASAATVLGQILITFAMLLFGVPSVYLLKFDLGVVWKKIKGKN